MVTGHLQREAGRIRDMLARAGRAVNMHDYPEGEITLPARIYVRGPNETPSALEFPAGTCRRCHLHEPIWHLRVVRVTADDQPFGVTLVHRAGVGCRRGELEEGELVETAEGRSYLIYRAATDHLFDRLMIRLTGGAT